MTGCGGECVGVVQGARRSGRERPASASQRARLADEHHGQGYSFRKQGNFAAAIEEYSQAIALEPQHFKALFNRGFSWDKVYACAKLAVQLTVLTAFRLSFTWLASAALSCSAPQQCCCCCLWSPHVSMTPAPQLPCGTLAFLLRPCSWQYR